MNLFKNSNVVLGAGVCCIFLCLTVQIQAAETAGKKENPIFEPGKEYHIVTDNEAIATKSFNLYVPLDYTEDRTWPVIICYSGQGRKYNPVICRAARMFTCDRGAIVIGMGYLLYERTKMTPAQFVNYIDREFRSICEAKELVSKHLRIDNERLFISGTSAGGWLASLLLEYKAQFWAGGLIFVAGLSQNASIVTNPASVRAFNGLPVFLGSSLPGSSHGANYKWAKMAEKLYVQRGAIVTSEI